MFFSLVNWQEDLKVMIYSVSYSFILVAFFCFCANEFFALLHSGTGVVANAVHPGVVDSDLGKPAMSSITKAFMFVMTPFIWPFIQAPRHGAQSVLYVALHPDLEKTTGQYFR